MFTNCTADDYDNAGVSNTASFAVFKPIAGAVDDTMTVVAKLNASHNTNTLNAGQVTIYLGITSLGNPQS